MVILRCQVCGTSFEWEQKGHEPHTCGSAECKRKRHSKSVRESRWRERGGETVQARVCLRCGEEFEFRRTAGMRGRGPGFCSDECREAHILADARNRQKSFRSGLAPEERSRRRRVALLARYSLTVEGYDRMLAEQGGVCAICGLAELKHHSTVLKIDHDRTCCPQDGLSCGKCIRGLLCSNCNRALGLFGDRPALLRAGAGYLEAHQKI